VGQPGRFGLVGTGGQVSPPMVAIGPLVPSLPDLDPSARDTAVATAATTASLTDHFRSFLIMPPP
jgi:hypothetical protein